MLLTDMKLPSLSFLPANLFPLWQQMRNLQEEVKNSNREPTAGESEEWQALSTRLDNLKSGRETFGRQVPPDSVIMDDPTRGPNSSKVITPQHLTMRQRQRGRVFEDDQTALRFANFIGAIVGAPRCIGFCAENSINIYAVQSSGVNAEGGYMVAPEFGDRLINLRDEYGVFRRYAFIDEMISDEKNTPRLTGHGQHYYVSEGQAITPSSIVINQVKLVTKKPAMLIIFSRELRDDSMIALGNLLADEIAWTMSYAEDLAGFTGDGTSTYGGIVGIIPRLSTLNGVDDGGGLVLGTGNAYSELTLNDFAKMVGITPAYAKKQGLARWHCSSYFYASVMLRLMINAGGNTVRNLEMGATDGPEFLGYPVSFSEVLPTAEANSQICCLFGDLSKAATLGDREGITLEQSNSATINM